MSKFTATIHKDSVPDLDNWGFDDYWDCDDWIKWYKARKQSYGATDAKETFLRYFSKRTAFGHELTCFNTSYFYDYFTREGVFSRDAAIEAVRGASNVVSNTAQSASNATKAISNISKYLPYILLVLALVLVFWALRNSKDLIKSIKLI